MKKFLFVLASTASLATVNAAIAQYPSAGYAPGYYPPGYYNPRLNYGPGDSWRRERALEEWRQWQNNETRRTPNYATGSGAFGLTNPNAVGGECAKGMSEETCRRRGQQYKPPSQN